ncbi:MAG TPA: FkbM family methyltransferase [Pyrinomonadaceae bacterium]|nr:FkbM family methyltransferase [Pyrinomonadaceae bacterium]
MLSVVLAKISASIPSSLKYPLAPLMPLYARLLSLGEPIIDVPSKAGQFRWRIDELTCQRIILGTYEPYMQKAFVRYVRKGATVFDVGAHAGYHTALCSLLVGEFGKVVSFEPHPKNIASLKSQIEVNRFRNVTVSSFALSDRCGVAQLDTSSGNSQGHVSQAGDFSICLRTMDELVRNEGFASPDLVKIDVEGHESEVLRGAQQTLVEFKPVVLCDYNDDRSFSEVRDILQPLGYSVSPGPPIIGIHGDQLN